MLTLVTGGCRSGKSRYALDQACQLEGGKLFLATCPKDSDPEMLKRIEAHRLERKGLGDWITEEESLDPIKMIEKHVDRHLLLDCLTLWVSNLMHEAYLNGEELTEKIVSERTEALVEVLKGRSKNSIVVTNETGLGIVPENAVARQYRDLIGRCNQVVGRHCDSMIFMVCGRPMSVVEPS